jgi:hypothetical protein
VIDEMASAPYCSRYAAIGGFNLFFDRLFHVLSIIYRVQLFEVGIISMGVRENSPPHTSNVRG